MTNRPMSLFALHGSLDLAERIAGRLEVAIAQHEERSFEDGEHKARPLHDVRGHDVFVLHSLFGDESESGNDKLCRLLFFCGALKDSGAECVSVITPYLCYARKDRRTKPHDPIITRYVAAMFEAMRRCTMSRPSRTHFVVRPGTWKAPPSWPRISPRGCGGRKSWPFHRTPAGPSGRNSSASIWNNWPNRMSAAPTWKSTAAAALSAASRSPVTLTARLR